MLSGCNMRGYSTRPQLHTIIVCPSPCFPISVRMLSGDKCLLNVYQMMAVHCLLFLENGDMYRGVAFLHLAPFSGSTMAQWSSGPPRLVILCLPLRNRTGPRPTSKGSNLAWGRRSDCAAYFGGTLTASCYR